jgi:tRNA-Thr(GGU) m(6)t(6)A37 methyltransferase TsaA
MGGQDGKVFGQPFAGMGFTVTGGKIVEIDAQRSRKTAPARPDGARGLTGGVHLNEPRYELTPIGTVESSLTDLALAPNQGDEGAPDAWLAFEPAVLEALDGIRAGDEVIVLTWLDRAHRDVLRVHPRGDVSRAQQGVFNTRSPDRPNPIGLHRVKVASIDGGRVRVSNLEAVDGTPIVDVKPVLSSDVSER